MRGRLVDESPVQHMRRRREGKCFTVTLTQQGGLNTEGGRKFTDLFVARRVVVLFEKALEVMLELVVEREQEPGSRSIS